MQGINRLMETTAITHLKGKIREFMTADDEREEDEGAQKEFNASRTFTNDFTASTVHRDRKQSFIYRNKRLSSFYDN